MSIARLAPSDPTPDARADGPAPPAHAAHPSGSASPGRGRPVGALSFKALRAIVGGLARVEQPLPDDDGEPGARSTRLIATAFYDVWLITWPDGTGLEPHDHGDVRSVLQVIDGQLSEAWTDRRADVGTAVRTLEVGSVSVAEPAVVHSLTNRSGRDATSLHVYSPPLVDVTFFDLLPAGHSTEVRSTPVADRPARATSHGVVAPDAGPLTVVRP